jgi:hypothetical protein
VSLQPTQASVGQCARERDAVGPEAALGTGFRRVLVGTQVLESLVAGFHLGSERVDGCEMGVR